MDAPAEKTESHAATPNLARQHQTEWEHDADNPDQILNVETIPRAWAVCSYQLLTNPAFLNVAEERQHSRLCWSSFGRGCELEPPMRRMIIALAIGALSGQTLAADLPRTRRRPSSPRRPFHLERHLCRLQWPLLCRHDHPFRWRIECSWTFNERSCCG